MTRKHCAFCDRAGPLTKEHLWPKSLHKRLEDASSGNKNYFWLKRLKQEIASEPQVRDVCANCNNGVLSELDSYICDLFDAQLIHMPKQHETVTFSFDYHLLKRWLLKLSFNSARIHDSPDRQALQVLRPYIIGSDIFLGRSTQLFLQLVHPEKIPESDLETEYRGKEEIIWEPDGNRTGHMFFRAHGIGEKLLRAVHLRSYSFFVAYWEPNAGSTEQNFFECVFGSQQRFATLLRPSKQSIQVVCDGMGAWESWRESRSTVFVFNEDV
jgi:hypothetical protein